MTHDNIGGKRKGRWSGERETTGQAGSHRLAVIAAIGAVAIGALALAGAVSSNVWSDASVQRAEAASQDSPKVAAAAGTPAKAEAASVEKVNVVKSGAVKSGPAKPAASDGKQAAASEKQPTQAAAKADTMHVAGGKTGSLSPDERIERAMARVTAGSDDMSVKKAITAAAREKLASGADTTITAALPDSAAYAPAQRDSGSDAALGAIRDLDKSAKSASREPAPADEPAQSREAPARAAPSSAAAAKPTGPMAPATVSTAVHMRASMDNGSAVVATVPASASVQASQSCEGWCEVVYDGRHGYIYKSFIRRQQAAAQTTAAASDDAAKAAAPAAATAAATSTSPDDGKGILTQTGNAQALVEAAQQSQRSR